MTKSLTLYELNNLVAEVVNIGMPDEYWVEAEVADAREVKGHCYIELVQKDDATNTPVARASAKCWRNVWMSVRQAFERETGQLFRAGLKVMLKVYANFHEAYGFAWIITDINPEYTMGDLALRRKKIIEALKAQGVYYLQKELSLPMFAQRVAVVSSDGAAGYGDFYRQITENDCGFRFHVQLFPAVMQGENVEKSVIAALDKIYEHADDFDVVVIIRGGGATSDLSGFDTLALAENVANFPLPIITGIGHDRDNSVLDLVACVSVKTPTAAAALLVDNLRTVANRIDKASAMLVGCARQSIERERMRLEHMASVLPTLFTLVRTRQETRLNRMAESISSAVRQHISEQWHVLDDIQRRCVVAVERIITAEHHRISVICHRAAALDPMRLLRRGYSITLRNGKAVRDAVELEDGDVVETVLAHGIVRSVVVATKEKTKDEDKK